MALDDLKYVPTQAGLDWVAGLAPEEKALVRKIFPIFFNSPREE